MVKSDNKKNHPGKDKKDKQVISLVLCGAAGLGGRR